MPESITRDQIAPNMAALEARGLHKTFKAGGRTVRALDDVSFSIRHNTVNGLLGPDGAGKTTLIRLAAGLFVPDFGSLTVLGLDSAADSLEIQSRIGYMPQKFGLYEDLTVAENMQLYADLQGVPHARREERTPRLMEMTGLGPFMKRLAGRLSGGMKQKLGLACVLIKTPELLLLDEPTVGVDPLSRRELWEIVFAMVKDQDLTVLMSTAYLDEAERCDNVVILHHGKMLGEGPPGDFTRKAEGRVFTLGEAPGEPPRHTQSRLLARPEVVDASLRGGRIGLVLEDGGAAVGLGEDFAPEPERPVFEDGFMLLLASAEQDAETDTGADGENGSGTHTVAGAAEDVAAGNGEPVIEVKDLTRRFGDFVAVNAINFEVRRGEIFGLLGPNGAGKSTTFRMLCGLLPPSGGTLTVAGVDLRTAAAKARQKVGYMAQKFSLYGQLSVRENLAFFSSAYGLTGKKRDERIRWALRSMNLEDVADAESGALPFGIRQRLSMACALMHEPEILFLDEPTSGVDPLSRRQFWRRITALAEAGVTVIVTTHFMEEAEYCDRMCIMVRGNLLALGTPEEIRGGSGGSIEDAFIGLVEEYREREGSA